MFVAFARPPTALTMTSLRAGPDGSLVVRIANPTQDEAVATLRFARQIASARSVDLREGEPDLGHIGLDVVRTAAPLDADGDAATVRLQPYEIGTWLVRLA